jgi:hypothetical protein
MLGVERDIAYGLGLGNYLSPQSARQLRDLVASNSAGRQARFCLLRLCPKDGTERPVRASIGADPSGRGYFVALTDVGDEPGSQSKPT